METDRSSHPPSRAQASWFLLVILTLGAPHSASAFGSRAPRTPATPELPRLERAANELRLLTYNVWGLPSPLLKKGKRIDLIIREIPTQDAAVIAFQEAFTDRARPLERLVEYPESAWGPDEGDRLIHSGLLTISRYPIVGVARLAYGTACKGFDCLSNKGALLTRIETPTHGVLDVFNTHLNADEVNAEARRRQVTQLIEFVRAEHSPAHELLVMGDFNFEQYDPEYRYLVSELELLDLQQAHIDQTPELSDLEREGYSSDPRSNPNLPATNRPKRLDYIFYRPRAGEAWDGTRLRRAGLTLRDPVRGLILSDHFAVFADLLR